MEWKEEDMTLEEALAVIRDELEEDRVFLTSYLLDESEEEAAARDGRIKHVLELAGKMEQILRDLSSRHEAITIPIMEGTYFGEDEDIDLKYRTHVLGRPDGGDNIEGDWDMSGDSGDNIFDFEGEGKKKKKKKHKKDKKEKKQKHGKKK